MREGGRRERFDEFIVMCEAYRVPSVDGRPDAGGSLTGLRGRIASKAYSEAIQ